MQTSVATTLNSKTLTWFKLKGQHVFFRKKKRLYGSLESLEIEEQSTRQWKIAYCFSNPPPQKDD